MRHVRFITTEYYPFYSGNRRRSGTQATEPDSLIRKNQSQQSTMTGFANLGSEMDKQILRIWCV